MNVIICLIGAKGNGPGRKVSRRTRRCHKLQSYYHPFWYWLLWFISSKCHDSQHVSRFLPVSFGIYYISSIPVPSQTISTSSPNPRFQAFELPPSSCPSSIYSLTFQFQKITMPSSHCRFQQFLPIRSIHVTPHRSYIVWSPKGLSALTINSWLIIRLILIARYLKSYGY